MTLNEMIEMKEFARGLGYTIRENDWIDHRKFTVMKVVIMLICVKPSLKILLREIYTQHKHFTLVN